MSGWSKRAHGEQGWTLIELLVVVSLITILAGIAVANYRSAVVSAQEAVLRENLFRMRDAIDQYYADKGRYPASLDTLVEERYLRRIPDDPITRSPTTWEVVAAEFDVTNPGVEPGIFDVKSGSDGVSLNGTPYKEW